MQRSHHDDDPVATVAAMVLLVSMSLWKRLVLLASIVPIALLSNILRITATGWCYRLFVRQRGRVRPRRGRLVDDADGAALVWLELTLLSWFFVETEEEEKKTSLRDSLLLWPPRGRVEGAERFSPGDVSVLRGDCP